MVKNPDGWPIEPEPGVQRWLQVAPPSDSAVPFEAPEGALISIDMITAVRGLFLRVAEIRLCAGQPVIAGVDTVEIAQALEDEGRSEAARKWVELGETAAPWNGQPRNGTNRVFGSVSSTGVLYDV